MIQSCLKGRMSSDKIIRMIIGKRKPLNRPGTATQQKGQDRLTSILEAARIVFCEQGYSSMTMRKVAAEAKISIGNLNYYYRTKEDLLRDLTEYVTDAYMEEFERIAKKAGKSPEKQFEAILDFWIQDLTTSETTVFFPELWALSNHNEYVAGLANAIYVRARAPLSDLIPQINPSLTKKEAQQLALYMCAAMEGLTIFAGYKKPYAKQMKELKRISIQNFITMVHNAKGSKHSSSCKKKT